MSSRNYYAGFLVLLGIVFVISVIGLILGSVAVNRHETLKTETKNNDTSIIADLGSIKSTIAKNTSDIAANTTALEGVSGLVNLSTVISTNQADIVVNKASIQTNRLAIRDIAMNLVGLDFDPGASITVITQDTNGKFYPVFMQKSITIPISQTMQMKVDGDGKLSFYGTSSESLTFTVVLHKGATAGTFNLYDASFDINNSDVPPPTSYNITSGSVTNPVATFTSSPTTINFEDLKTYNFYLLTDLNTSPLTQGSYFNGKLQFRFEHN